MNMEFKNHTEKQEKRKRTEDEEEYSVSESGREWLSLPDVCLQHIFKFLPDSDRISAIQVCHRWYAVMMYCPALWRCRDFHLSGQPMFRSEYSSTIGYVRSLGVHLKKLEIYVYPPSRSLLSQPLGKTITDLLAELIRVKAELQSFSLIRLELTRSCWRKDLKKSLFDSVMDFLRRGSAKLTSLSLVNMRTTMDQGLELLSVLSHSKSGTPSGCNITHLNLEGFFSSALRVYTNTNMATVMTNLQHLTDLTLSYSCVSDELLLALKPKQKVKSDPCEKRRRLQTLSLYCTVHEPHHQSVNSGSWASLVSNCPDLKVKLTLGHVINLERLRRILLPEIPLTEFNMTGFYSLSDDRSGIPLLSELLPQFCLSLRSLCLDLSNWNEVLDEQLLDLVNVCGQLEQLDVSAFMELSTMERLLQIRLLHRTSLNYIRVTIYIGSYTDKREEENRLREIISSYSDLPSELDFIAKICSNC